MNPKDIDALMHQLADVLRAVTRSAGKGAGKLASEAADSFARAAYQRLSAEDWRNMAGDFQQRAATLATRAAADAETAIVRQALAFAATLAATAI